MPTPAPSPTQNLDYVPLYPDVSGGDRVGALNRIDGALVPVLANNIEWLRRRAAGVLDVSALTSLLKSVLANIEVVDEVPSGVRDSLNVTFGTASPFAPGTLKLNFNGLLLTPGGSNDYVEAASHSGFTMSMAPDSVDFLLVSYLKA